MIIKLRYSWIISFFAVLLTAVILCVNIFFPSSALAQSTNVDENAVKLPVIMYHHILKDTTRRGDYVISPSQFEADLQYIKKQGYQTISCGELVAFLDGQAELPQKPLLITFDDGYETVHEYAFPLLQKYEMKAIINIIGCHTDIFSKESEPHHLSYSHVNWEQLNEMLKSGVFEVGNHTYDMHGEKGKNRYGIGHKQGESDESYKGFIKNDIGSLNQKITEQTGVVPLAFAYPFGNIPKDSLETIKSLGFKLLFTCEEKVNYLTTNTELPLKLKRFNRAGRYETWEFFKKLV